MGVALPKGHVIAGMTIMDELGSGGFGITYLAREDTSQQFVALKEYFPAEFATRTRGHNVQPQHGWRELFDLGLAAFMTEANILKTLPRQTGLVRVKGAFKKHKTAYCVMEYIKGDPMDRMVPRMIQQYGAVPEALVRQFVVSITQALATLHDRGLIHRDVKPANVMIRRNGQPVLIDFGAARPFRKTDNAAIMYTKKYAAIEQFPLNQADMDQRLTEGPWTDIFALSVMLYEMLNGRAPVDAQTRFLAVSAGNVDPYIPLATALKLSPKPEKYPARLLKMIDHGCALLPEDRPANATGFCEIYVDAEHAALRDLTRHSKFGMAERVGDAVRGAGLRFAGGDGVTRAKPLSTTDQNRQAHRSGTYKMLGLIFALALVAMLYGLMSQPALKGF